MAPPTLHLLCGKIAAGKSTPAAELARQPNTVMIAEDFWLARLYPGEILTIEDQARCSARLCAAACRSCWTFMPTPSAAGPGCEA